MTLHDTTALQDRTVGEIAANLPGATSVFRRYKIDFCCSGDRPLRVAAQRRAVEPAELEQALLRLEGTPEDAAPRDTEALIDHILLRYHGGHRRALPELLTLARKVETVHADHPKAPRGLAAALETFARTLEAHMQTEEAVLFPLMRRDDNPLIAHPIEAMRDEHEDHGTEIYRLQGLTDGFTPPADACRSWRALYTGLASFVDDLMVHVHLENNVLFPRFERGERI